MHYVSIHQLISIQVNCNTEYTPSCKTFRTFKGFYRNDIKTVLDSVDYNDMSGKRNKLISDAFRGRRYKKIVKYVGKM